MKNILLYSLLCVSILSGCKKENGLEYPAQKEKTNRTVLMYLFQDTNLAEPLTDNINDLERGWNSEINGTMLVYVDPSTKMTQFDGKPVLLEITRDTSNLIVSRIVKVYPDTDATNPTTFKQVQDDAIAMYPADSYGLIISGHGNGFMISSEQSKGLTGSDRWGNKFLEVDLIARNLSTHYDFIMFDACMMAETATLYELRAGTDFVVASVELSPGDGFAYRSDLKALFAQPKADLFTFVRSTANYYQNTPQGRLSVDPDTTYTTIGVYRMSAMENLATVTKKALGKINLKYDKLRDDLIAIVNSGKYGIPNAMYYPRNYPKPQVHEYDYQAYYHDFNLLAIKLIEINEKDLCNELIFAVNAVVIQKYFAYSEIFAKENPRYMELSANMSFYIPKKFELSDEYQTNAFYTRFGWSQASGFTNQWE